VISSSPREALYVLDGLVESNTILRPREHYTDTHGFTDHIFALSYLLGYSFMSRLWDLADQQYKLDRKASFGKLDTLIRGTADAELIAEQLDQLAWVASSVKSRTAFCPRLRVVKRDLGDRSEQFDRCPEYSHAIADADAVAVAVAIHAAVRLPSVSSFQHEPILKLRESGVREELL
jgi:hypothetical protein